VSQREEMPAGGETASAGGGARPLEIAVVTPLFPLPGEPHRGIFIYRTVRELARLATVRVLCPVAVYPPWRFLQPRTYTPHLPDPHYRPGGLDVTYASYRTLPAVGRPFNGLLSGRLILRWLQERRPAVVLAYWLYPEGWGAVWAARKLGIPVVLGARGSDLRRPGDWLSARLTRQALRRATLVITVSEDLKRIAIEMGVPAERVQSIPNGCDLDVFFPADRLEARRELRIAADRRVVLFVGRLVEVKGVEVLVEAARLALARSPSLELVLVGDGPLRESLERQAREKLGAHARFTGPLPPEKIARWMAAADVVCLPSYSEGCPNVVIEALACGRPVVASEVGGVPELVSADTGILVPPGRPEALAEALVKALECDWDPQAIAALQRRGWDRVAAETYRVCEQASREKVNWTGA
jgi:teichuronic acid biosynthesis glycosyltransferase TuaC